MQSFLNQVIYFGFFQSILLVLVYLFSKSNRKHINGYLAFLVVVLMIGLIGRILNISEIFGRSFRFTALSEFSVLLFGATIYSFTRSSLLNKSFSYRDLLHYIPALIYSVIIVFYIMLPSDEVYRTRAVNGELLLFVYILMGSGLVVNITYWVMSLRIFVQFKKELQNELSYTVKTQFFRNFLVAVGICLTYWVSMYVASLVNQEFINNTNRQIIWLSVAMVILFIAYYGLKAPELFKVAPTASKKKYANSKLTTSDLDRLKKKLDELMEQKKPYLNGNLMKAELAEMLGVSNPEIARLLNENIGMNFFEYVNYYRIREFIELAKTDQAKNLTFFGLAQEAGFNSKTTFNKSFKKLMGTSPKEYLAGVGV